MHRSLPIANPSPPALRASVPTPASWPELLAELQAVGLRWLDPQGPGLNRKGGAGPSDHKAITLASHTVMVPIHTRTAERSPYSALVDVDGESALLIRRGKPIAELTFPREPRFYSLSTADGTPYWKIATLHGRDVLASTVLQTCTRYGKRESSCQFCAIGQSLAAHATIAEKTPAQLAEVAEAAVRLDSVTHAVLTTGTPHTPDRGAEHLCNVVRGMRERVALPTQVQCEPPADLRWLDRLKQAGADALGMHLESVSEPVRQRIMPGKASVPIEFYLRAFEHAVPIFGRGQVSTYILAGLGDTREEILNMSERLLTLGVYPFVVPFVPISGTPLEHATPPDPAFMQALLADVAALISRAAMKSSSIKAGCGRCGACSSLAVREAHRA
ncbi:MAG TPA: MSMEG_0568 family radical SAM protein [Polyangiaceae bacterium]|nr:MSMEG_0568 family radical SAM protein [Polyangiaceae bacterium]